jgi:glycerophosphoryl diester phosphodiesterase
VEGNDSIRKEGKDVMAVMRVEVLLSLICTLVGVGGADACAVEPAWWNNGVTAHRGNSVEYPENTLAAFESGVEAGADWLELDIFRTADGRLVVIHDRSTGRVADRDIDVVASTFAELLAVDVAAEFRRRKEKTIEECPPARIPSLEDVLRLVMTQRRTRVSIQPKMDCVADAVALVRKLKAERWVGFNDGSLEFMAEVKRLAPEIPVFWDRGAKTDIDADIRVAKQHGFESLVLHFSGVTPEKVQKIRAAGLECGAWTVNDRATMTRLLDAGVQRLYTDDPRTLLGLISERQFRNVECEGSYAHHLQGVCVADEAIYWSFTTTLVKTDRAGHVLKKIPVANHHGDLCFHDGRLYVAVNLGRFNDPQGNADSWVYVYDAKTLDEVARHETQQAFHGAGGIGFCDGHFFVVGGLPDGVQENYVYEYDSHFAFVRRHVIPSGHTHLGIQTATFTDGRWWFGCYGSPQVTLVTDANFRMLGRFERDCSLGIAGLPGGRLLVASGRCSKDEGCVGSVRAAIADEASGFRVHIKAK